MTMNTDNNGFSVVRGTASSLAAASCSMKVGVFEYHQWPLQSTFGKIQL